MAENDDVPRSKKLFGLPQWSWWVIGGAGLAFAWYLYKKRQASNTAAQNASGATAPTDTSTNQGIPTEEYESLLALLRDLQGQESSEPMPQPGPPGPPGPPGRPAPNPPAGPGPPVPAPGPSQPVPGPVPPPSPVPTHKTVTVKSGDTLWNIATREYGSGSRYRTILSANLPLIERMAESHGRTKAQADTGSYIYPGEVLTIP